MFSNLWKKITGKDKVSLNIEKINNKHIEKIKSLKIDIQHLYEITQNFNEKIKESENINKIFKSTFDSAFDALIIIDESGKIKLMNESAQKIFGDNITPGISYENILKFLNLPLSDSVVAETFRTLKSSIRSEKYLSSTNLFKNKKINLVTTPIFSDKKQKALSYIILQFKDISIILDSKIKFDLILDDINFIYWDLDLNKDKILYENSWKEIFEYNYRCGDINEFLEYFNKFIHPDDLNDIKNIFLEALLLNSDIIFSFECRIKTLNNNYIWMFFKGNISSNNLSFNDLKRKIKISAVLLSNEKYNEIYKLNLKDRKHIISIISKINNNLLSFNSNNNENIKSSIIFLKNEININDFAYIQFGKYRKKKNIISYNKKIDFENECLILSEKNWNKVQSNNSITELEIEKKSALRTQYNLKFGYYLLIKTNDEISGLLMLFSEKKIDKSNFDLIKLLCSIIQREEKLFIDDLLIDISHIMLNETKKWIWIKNVNNEIIYINKQLKEEIFDFYLLDEYPGYFLNLDSNEAVDLLPEDIRNLFRDKFNFKDFVINKNNEEIKIKSKSKILLRRTDRIWFYSAEEIKC